MGDMRSAIADDEDDWYDLKEKAKIQQMAWKVYSNQATFAKEGFNKHGYTGKTLIEYVDLKTKLIELDNRHSAEEKEYKEYLRLKKKFDK